MRFFGGTRIRDLFSAFGMRRALALVFVAAIQIFAGASSAFAISASCAAINAIGPTTNYIHTFAVGTFSAGESVTASFVDNGRGSGGMTMPGMENVIMLNKANLENTYVYFARATAAGPQTLTAPADFIAQHGLTILVRAGREIPSVTLTCGGARSTNASLSNLAPNSASLTPAFAAGTTSYTVNVANNVSSISLTPTLADATAAVTINGSATASGSASAPINLSVGNNIINAVVTAEDGTTTRTYTVTVVRAAPVSAVVSGVIVPPAGTYKAGQTLSFTVNFDQAVTVTGTPSIALAIGSSSRAARYVSGSGTAALTFAYTVVDGDLDNDGIGIGNLSLDGGSIAGVDGSAASLPLNSVGSTSQVLVDAVAPTVVSTAAEVAPASGSATFRVVFSEDVTGLAAANFSLVGTDTAAGRITGMTGSGKDYRVQVAGISGVGSLRLDVVASASVADAAGNAFRGGFSSGTPLALTGSADASLVLVATNANNGVLVPAFSPAVTSYSQVVPYNVATITVSFQKNDPLAGVTINGAAPSGTGAAGYATIPLSVGVNTVSLAVTAQDGVSTRTYTVAITRAAAATLVLTPADGAIADGKVGAAYPGVTVAASNGTAPYAYAVTSGRLPAGLALDAASGRIAGAATEAGTFDFTVSATDGSNALGSARYSVKIEAAASAGFTFVPAAGALPEAMAGEDYSQSVTTTGGAGSLIFSVATGTLPEGLVLNVSNGTLTGPLATTAQGDYSFVIEARDTSGATGKVAYTLHVKDRAVTVADKVIDVPAGSTPNDVYLNRGATGGPFVSAEATYVEPANAGTATIVRGTLAQLAPTAPSGWYLQFTPNPAYSGQVRVGYRLTSTLGTSNTGTVTYRLGYNADQVRSDINALVTGFVQTRQSLISSGMAIPGLMDRRRAALATEAVTTVVSPSSDGVRLGFSTSLAQMQAARDNADGVSAATMSPFNIWIDGVFMAHNRDDNGNKWGSFGMLNLGVDYLLNEKALIGFSVHYDRMTDPTKEDANLTGNGWLVGPNASFEVGKGVFWDTSLLYGGSSNTIDTRFWDGTFDTTRWMLDTAIKGEWQIGEATVLTPKLRAVYFSEKVENYSVRNDAGDQLDIGGFDVRQFRVSLGAEIARSFRLENDAVLTPKIGLTGGFSGLDGSGAFGSITAGVSFKTADDWMFDANLLFNIEGQGQKSGGGKIGVSRRF